MDIKKKLEEIVCEAMNGECVGHCNHPPCTKVEVVVDNLIANGVTVQEWISVKDRLPDEHETVLVWLGNNRSTDWRIANFRKSTDSMHEGRWWRWGNWVTHWSPWNMPDPPKGE